MWFYRRFWSLLAAFVLFDVCLKSWLDFIFRAAARDLPLTFTPLAHISQKARLKESQCRVTSEGFEIDRLDPRCFCASYKRATGFRRRRDDNGAGLTNSWVEVSWLLVRRNEQSEELWCCEWMKWVLCDSRCALWSRQEARPAQQPLVSQSKQHP